MKVETIRNFSIIAHIDHGKSTLADRMLELTGTVEKRKMREQVLDEMELERERGITIKMTPVRMSYTFGSEKYTLNLIDTPGHIDFSYEVSRALKAVEGAVLLVDATQGVQAQTLTTLFTAQELGLVIVPVVTKIDSPNARVEEVREEVRELLSCPPSEVLAVSGKTGEGVDTLLQKVIKRIPHPEPDPLQTGTQALVFDFSYSEHRGVVVFMRIVKGEVRKGDDMLFVATKERFKAQEVGTLSPDARVEESLSAGEIGYVVTGIKAPDKALIGDTITGVRNALPQLPGYKNPQPVVWASVYPESQDDFTAFRQALARLKLSDAALSFEEELSTVLGRGFRCGFLGMLHLEIIIERLRREFGLALIVAAPSIVYEIEKNDGSKEKIYSPAQFPDHGQFRAVHEPWVSMRIITPEEMVGSIMRLLYQHEGITDSSSSFGEKRIMFISEMPLRELMRGFFEGIKSASSGYASFSYTIGEMKKADVIRLDLFVAEEQVPAFSQVIPRHSAYEEAKSTVERLYSILPRQLFPVKIQGVALGRILASKTLPALKKDVTGHLYGGDITRKRKLWEKQKKGKKRLRERGRVEIPQEVFLKMIKRE